MQHRAAPMRILCLHGFSQTAASLKRVLGLGYFQRVGSIAEHSFLDAPFDVPDHNVSGRAWFLPERDTNGEWLYRGWEQTLDALAAMDAREGPFDGVMGFSQGASVASALSALATRGQSPLERLRFAIMVSGFEFRARHVAGNDFLFTGAALDFPSLHVYGRRDQIVKPETSQRLAAKFASPVVYEHGNGHSFPQTKEALGVMGAFLRENARADTADGPSRLEGRAVTQG